jgi:peptidase C25-like protein/VCBS repeat protein
MRVRLQTVAFAWLILAAAAGPAPAAPAVLERELRYDASRFSVVQKGGETQVGMAGAAREFIPGRPDLPMVGELIELPAGVRVVGVEVVSLATAMLSPAARVPTAARAKHEIGPIDRTDPDPEFYGRSGFAPASAQVELGYQGWMRGRHLASLRVNPVRWDAASGRLERIERMTVRLRLEPHVGPDVVPRERIVPEWEVDRPSLAARPVASAASARPAQPFKPTQVPSVLGSPVAYVIITKDALAAEFQRLADWKTQSGVPAVVRTLEFVRQEYPFGADDADRIRQFIRDAYGRWGTKWVLLGGDTEVIPHRNIYTTFFLTETIPCDMYFSCLDGNWNADGDSTYGEGFISTANPGDASDVLPEVYVGRAPVASVADVQRFVDKTFQYTRTPVGDYEHQMMFFAEVLFPQYWQPGQGTSLDGAELVEDVLPSLDPNPNLRYTRLYENYLDARWEPGSLQETRAFVIDSLNAGYNMAIHVGHGYRNVLSVGDYTIENAHAQALTNGDRLCNLYSIGCNGSSIDFPCIAEAFINAPNGGAVTYIGSTRFDFPQAGRAFKTEYFRLMFEDSVTAVGEAHTKQKLPFAASSVGDNINRWTSTTLVLLGDPELRQWTGTPRTLAVAHPPSYALGDTSMLVNVMTGGSPLMGATVTLYKPGDDLRSATTNGAGNALVEFRPGQTGSFYLTVTGFDCRPWQDTLTVGAGAAAALDNLVPVVDDDLNGGTSGNSNTLLDAGEVVDLQIPIINRGGSTATAVNGVLSTTDGLVTILDADVSYGTIAPSASSAGSGAFRLSLPYMCPDQREIPLKIDLVDTEGRHYIQRLVLVVHSPEPRHFTHTVVDFPGDQDGVPENGETITMLIKMRNLGTGPASGVTAILRNYDGQATVTDSTTVFGSLTPGQEAQGDALVYTVGNTSAKLELRISNALGLLSTQVIDLARPVAPTALAAMGNQSSISLTWARNAAADLAGYNVYRSLAPAGPYARINEVPTDRTSYYLDEGLVPLTRYYYRLAAVDSSGNESPLSGIIDASTNPPNHGLFPFDMRRETPAPVALDYVYQHSMMDVFAGADVMWAWHSDGTTPIDADGTALTPGDFTTRGSYYAAGVSLASLDGNNWSIIGGSWRTTPPESLSVYVLDKQGNVRTGWPFVATGGIFSSVAVGDLDNDGSRELVFGSNTERFYVLRADGSEWIDGDANPATQGIFKVLGTPYNYGTPALADLDGNGQLDIVYAAFEGKLFAWRPNGTNLPGFPVTLAYSMTGSVAIGYLDGADDTQLDIAIAAPNDSLYVIKADGGRRNGFPIGVRFGGTTKQPSPALADMNVDGYLDIVVAGTDGKIRVYDRTGVLHPGFTNSRYSVLTNFASESSPVVADITGDLLPDVVMGDENGALSGISGTGAPLPGFPIQLGGEVRGTPALCDCDGDGLSEIVVSSWDKKTYMWDYDLAFSPAGPPPWPQFHHDARRTGLASSLVFLDAPPPVAQVAVASIELSRPEPNPARAITRFRWAVPAAEAGADLDLSVYDLAGRRLATLASGLAREGRFAQEWDLRAEDGARVGSGIYFLRLRLGTTTTSRKLAVMP